MIKVKKILVGIGCAVVFLAYFGLSLSCASTPKVSGSEKESGSEVTISLPKTENDWDAYDIELVSENPSPSRILKLISKETEDKKVFYAISEPGNTKVLKKVTNNGSSTLIEMDENLVTSSELEGKYLISEEDAKKAVDFINQLEKDFKTERTGDGVLDKFEVFNVVEREIKGNQNKSLFSIPTVNSSEVENEENKIVIVEEKTRIFFIQHSTSYGKDEILYSANDPKIKTETGALKSVPPVVVSLEEILAVRDALTK